MTLVGLLPKPDDKDNFVCISLINIRSDGTSIRLEWRDCNLDENMLQLNNRQCAVLRDFLISQDLGEVA